MNAKKYSYHDVTVWIDGKPHRIADNYAWQLDCSRVAGWQLYYIWGGTEQLLGGEYDSNDFRIEVAGITICGSPPESPQEQAEPDVIK